MRTPRTAALALSGLLLCACTSGTDPGRPRAAQEPPDAAATATEDALPVLDPDLSLTAAGGDLLRTSRFAGVPRVDLVASADPESGHVEGTLTARLPVGSAEEVRLRWFPGLDGFDADPGTGPATVEGRPADVRQDGGVLLVALPAGHGDEVTVRLDFGYTLPEAEEPSLLGGMEPAEVGLLARRTDLLTLGHWFPLWIPEGHRADPNPDGYGDIGNFAAADISLELTVPEGWDVVDGGVRVDESVADGRTTVTSYGTGMRDLSVALVRGYASRTRDVSGVTLSAWAPRRAARHLTGVLDETEAAMRTLSQELGPYPWREFDVVATPLGSGVSGMEWPGATWIESGVFAGGVPGLGDLGGLLGDTGTPGELEGLDDLGALGGPVGDLGLMLDTSRRWTIAHEVAHSWWTILVGNDSIADPVVDEPLAQYSSCLVVREGLPNAGEVCRAQIVSAYEGMRSLGESDTVADAASDEFRSPFQYSGVVYGKAAWFYIALEEVYGVDRVTDALAALVDRHDFETVTGDDVRSLLMAELGPRAGRLWDRWMRQRHGDADLAEPR